MFVSLCKVINVEETFKYNVFTYGSVSRGKSDYTKNDMSLSLWLSVLKAL